MIIQRLLIIFISITLARYAQAWIAFKMGDPTPKVTGRLTPNPLLHTDIFGTLILPLLLLLLSNGVIVLGYARQLPFNPYHLRKLRRDIRIVALTISAVHMSCAFIAYLLFKVGKGDLNQSIIDSQSGVVFHINNCFTACLTSGQTQEHKYCCKPGDNSHFNPPCI